MRKTLGLLILLLGLCFQVCIAQTRQISGLVTDKNDKSPLPGVTVMIKGTSTGTVTGVDGHYAIKAQNGDILVYTFIGMKAQEVVLQNQQEVNIAMEPESQSIDEVVVIGYGVRKKGSITGSVSTLKSDKLANIPVASFDQALQGAAPGLQIISGSGQPNSPASFTLRGINSLSAGSTPLFILDGMQISATDIASINPNDIESINVLKDASSTAIYGARATNGVIIITTKRGQMSEKAKVTARVQVGLSNLAFGRWNVMNTKEKLDYEEEIGLHASDPGYNRADWENTDIDWRDAVFNNNAPLQSYEVSVSGASAKTNYYFSGSMYDQEGITYQTFFRRYSTRLNLDTKANDWLKIGTNITASFEKYRSDPSEGTAALNGPLAGATSMNPYWNPYKEDGSISTSLDGSWPSQEYQNPLGFIESIDMKNSKSKFIGTVFAEITPIKGLILKSLGGADFTYFMSSIKNDPEYVTNNGEGSVTENAGRVYTLQISNTADYSFQLGADHNIRMLLGQEANYHEDFAFGIRGNGYSDKRLLELSLATSFANGISQKTVTTFLSFFGRAEYNFREKYYLDATYRRDGSSRFGADTKWGNFWSLGFMWNAKKEGFLSDNRLFSAATTAFTIGTQGNSAIPDYIYLATLTPYSYDQKNGMIPGTIGNPDLTWEKTRSMNWNLQLGFWNRVNMNVDIYHKITTDMLMQVNVSMTSGFSRNYDNVGKMTNTGVDFDLNTAVIRTPEFSWNIGFNFSYNRNRLKELYYGTTEITDESEGLKFQIDHPIGEFYVNRFAGVNPANGDALWYTKDGDITNEFREEDAVVTGQSYISPWSGGFSTSLAYKGFAISAQFSWIGKRYINNVDRFFSESNGKYAALNQSKCLLYDRWKKPGDIANVPRHGIAMQYDDRLLENAAFLRMKNLNISYSFPQELMMRTRFIESLKIYGQAQNLFTLTKFSGLDPEVATASYAGHYPLSRQLSVGLEVTF